MQFIGPPQPKNNDSFLRLPLTTDRLQTPQTGRVTAVMIADYAFSNSRTINMSEKIHFSL